MRQAVYNYLNMYEPFNMFGTEHVLANIISLLVVIVLPLYAKRHLNENPTYHRKNIRMAGI